MTLVNENIFDVFSECLLNYVYFFSFVFETVFEPVFELSFLEA